MKFKTPLDAATWWTHFGLRHYVPGESQEEKMKWAYEQGVLADQIQDEMGQVTMEFSETSEEKDASIFDKLGITECEEEIMKVDGFDDCIIGTVERFAANRVLLYSTHKMIEKLVESGMGLEEAWKYFNFNIAGAWVGEGTPAFAHLAE